MEGPRAAFVDVDVWRFKICGPARKNNLKFGWNLLSLNGFGDHRRVTAAPKGLDVQLVNVKEGEGGEVGGVVGKLPWIDKRC